MRGRASSLLLAVLTMACGSSEPSDDSVAGIWNASVTAEGQLPGGPVVTCAVSWAMAIEDLGSPGDPSLYTMIPYTPHYTCDNGYEAGWEYRTHSFNVLQEGSTIVLLSTSRADTFLVATQRGSTLRGEIGQYFYPSATFVASRRGGPDPNLQPGYLDIFAPFPSIRIGDTLRVGAQVADGYLRPLDTLVIAWTSSDPDVATVDAGGLVTGLQAGETTIVATVPGVQDTESLRVEP